MAQISECGMRLDGVVRKAVYNTDEKSGARYLTAQIENDDGISDVRFSADATRAHNGLSRGDLVSWVVRPWLMSGVSKRTGSSYAFLHIDYVRDAPEA